MIFRYIVSRLFVMLILVGCTFSPEIDNGIALPSEGGYVSGTPQGNENKGSDWYQVYFTDPDAPYAGTLRGGPDADLAEAIDQARLSVDIAVDNLNLWSLRDALITAHRRGLEVRVVGESKNMDSVEIQELLEKGVPVVEDLCVGLMHNKFVIIDRLEVCTGSMNLTVNGAYRSDNNLICIRSAELAQDYLVEFDEMYFENQFGAGSPANTPYPVLSVGETKLEVFFSPDDGTINRLIELVQSAENRIVFMAYSFTDDELAQAILERAREGVHIAGVLDESQALSNIGGEYTRFLENGIDVRLDGNPHGMHHKVIIIDDRIVITGSYNFSNNAKTRNDENTLIIHNPEIAALYRDEFERVWSLAPETVE